MRRKLVAFLGAAIVAAVLAQPVLAAKTPPIGSGGRAGSTIVANRN
jgi:hypothetical protein